MKPPPALPRISSTVVSKLGIIKIVKRASRSQLICLMDRSLYRRSRRFRAAYENPEPQIIAIRSSAQPVGARINSSGICACGFFMFVVALSNQVLAISDRCSLTLGWGKKDAPSNPLIRHLARDLCFPARSVRPQEPRYRYPERLIFGEEPLPVVRQQRPA
jgi:hypothetical protein